MLRSKTVLAHILRGVIGFCVLVSAILLARNADTASLLASVTLAIVALIALRGCPACWTIGLFEIMRGKGPAHVQHAPMSAAECDSGAALKSSSAATRRKFRRGRTCG